MAVATKAPEKLMEIPAMDLQMAAFYLVGDSPLITHAWSAKAIKQIADKQQGKATGTARREKKDPEADYQAAFHRLPDGRPGFPSVGFKAAAVSAATQLSGTTKVFLRGAFHVIGDLVPIEGEPRMREDMVRVGMGTADIRYRPEFPDWSTRLTVRFNARSISLEQLVQLFNQAGFSVGVGEWRPEKDGTFGMFHVERVEHAGTSRGLNGGAAVVS